MLSSNVSTEICRPPTSSGAIISYRGLLPLSQRNNDSTISVQTCSLFPRFIGLIVASCEAVRYAQFHHGLLELHILAVWDKRSHFLNCCICPKCKTMFALVWWVKNSAWSSGFPLTGLEGSYEGDQTIGLGRSLGYLLGTEDLVARENLSSNQYSGVLSFLVYPATLHLSTGSSSNSDSIRQHHISSIPHPSKRKQKS